MSWDMCLSGSKLFMYQATQTFFCVKNAKQAYV